MPHNVLSAPTPSVISVLKAFLTIGEDLSPSTAVRINVTPAIGNSFELKTAGSKLEEHPVMRANLELYASRPHIPAHNATLALTNGQNQEVRVNFGEQHEGGPGFKYEQLGDVNLALQVADRLHLHLGASSRPLVLGTALPKAERELIQFQATAVRALEDQAAKVGDFLLKQAAIQTKHVNKLTTDLEEKFQKREQDLTERFQRQMDEFQKQKEQFAKEKAAFDDRDRTHVRRSLLEKLQTIVKEHKEKVGVTVETAKKRRIVHGVCGGVIGGAAILLGIYASKILAAPAFDWRLEIPFITSSLLLGSTIIYYLKWNNHWFSELAKAEFAARKFESDITRASWIAEFFFEYKDEKNHYPPSELLASLSQNLFQDVDLGSQAHHPLDQVLGMVKGAKTLKVAADGIEVSRK
jgi:hypothetical protein